MYNECIVFRKGKRKGRGAEPLLPSLVQRIRKYRDVPLLYNECHFFHKFNVAGARRWTATAMFSAEE
jgi:hypothetical protein